MSFESLFEKSDRKRAVEKIPVFIIYLVYVPIVFSIEQHVPCGLSDTDHQMWENISHVALREILLARIRGI